MSSSDLTIFVLFEEYCEVIQQTSSPQQAQRLQNELQTVLLRYVLPIIERDYQPSGRKLTKKLVKEGLARLKKIPALVLLEKGLDALEQGFKKYKASQASRHTYGGRFKQFVSFVAKKLPVALKLEDIAAQCSPPKKNLKGGVCNTKLTHRQGQYQQYALQSEEMSPALQAEMDRLYQFMVAPNFPGRTIPPIKLSTAKMYMRGTQLWLGWLYRHSHHSITRADLSLSCLVPVVTIDELEDLSPKQQRQRWRQAKQHLEKIIAGYYEFMRITMKSFSPRSRTQKITVLEMIAKFLYLDEVEEAKDYRQIPLFSVLSRFSQKLNEEASEWTKSRHYVSDQEKKWPDVPEGQTALQVIQREVVEPLRLNCRPRYANQKYKPGHVLARHYMYYLKWFVFACIPPRRQQEYRNLRIALSCPVERPADLPPDSYYHPPLPLEQREKFPDGTCQDNYLYKTYIHDGQTYPDGVWILEVNDFKTKKKLGTYCRILKNSKFNDNSCFYDYLEEYLYGYWQVTPSRNSHLYDWWDASKRGQRGRWITSGRSDMNPIDTCHVTDKGMEFTQGYLFFNPTTGQQASSNAFGKSLETTAHDLIGKRPTPHTMRYIWATWAYQAELDDRELRSLAYAMGHRVETLQDMYERSTAADKLKPIQEAIERFQGSKSEGLSEAEVILQQLKQASPEVREEIYQALKRERG